MRSWKSQLQQMIPPGCRVAVLGIGQVLCGDDAAGVLAARHLRRLVGVGDRWLIVEAGLAPENFVGQVCRMAAEQVILVDAAYMGDQPGEIRVLDWRLVDEMSASTHALPIHLLGEYLVMETGCALTLVGIQAGDTRFGQRSSPVIRRAAVQVARGLAQVLGVCGERIGLGTDGMSGR